MKKITTILVLIIMIAISPISSFLSPDVVYAAELPQLEATGGVVIDINTGIVLYDKDMNVQKEPASTTKIMTCILALENLDLEQIVEIDHETSFTGGSRIYLIEGEYMSVEHLLYAMMLESANDSAVALAKAVAGSVEDFAAMMNAKAKELGALNTNFVNPNGLHAEGHLSTPYDMALIARYAMQDPMFRKLVTTYTHTIPETNKQPERYMYNTNRLIYDYNTNVTINGTTRPCKYDGCTGIKTGYTPQAGGCLVTGAKYYDTEVISVVMQSSDLGRFADSIALLDYAFASFHTTKAMEAGVDTGYIKVAHGAVKGVHTQTASGAYVLLPAEASTSIVNTKIVWQDEIRAPIKEGQKLGEVEIYEGEKLNTTVDIIAMEDVGEGTILSYVGIENSTARIIFIVGGALLAIILILGTYISILRAKKKKKMKALREKRAMEIALEREERRKEQELRNWFF